MLYADLFPEPEHLTEMPRFVDKEMPPNQVDWTDVGIEKDTDANGDQFEFLSDGALQREWKLMKIMNGSNVRVYINNAHTAAVIGEYGQRGGNVPKSGLRCYVTASFHESQMLSNDPNLQLKGALQIDVVEVNRNETKSRGYGAGLYFALVDAGLSIISDNTQYRGGKALWIKLAQMAAPKFQVNIIENGKAKLDENGKAFVWNGNNVPQDQLWSANNDKAFTLFVLRKA